MEEEQHLTGKPGPEGTAKHMTPRRVHMDDLGRVVVPASFRNALGFVKGQELVMKCDDDGIRLYSLSKALAHVWAIADRRRSSSASVVDDFISERRREAAVDE